MQKYVSSGVVFNTLYITFYDFPRAFLEKYLKPFASMILSWIIFRNHHFETIDGTACVTYVSERFWLLNALASAMFSKKMQLLWIAQFTSSKYYIRFLTQKETSYLFVINT